MNLCKKCESAEICKAKCAAQKKADDDEYWYKRELSEYGSEHISRRYQRWRENIGNSDNDNSDTKNYRTKRYKQPKFLHKESEE